MPSNLREQVDENVMSVWRTPSARDFRTGSAKREGRQINLNDQTGGQLNPDWVEELMGFPEGWTNPDVDEPRPWRGWPAPMGARLYISDVKHGLVSDQYPYEFPRTVKGGKHRAARIKALGNAVVPQQAYPFFRAISEMDSLIKEDELP